MQKVPLGAYQINGIAKHYIMVCHGNLRLLEDTLLIAAAFQSLLSEVLDWPSVLHNSKFRVPGKAVTPVITIVFLCIYFCVLSSVNIHWASMVPSQW